MANQNMRSGKPLTILVVDDEEAHASIMAECLVKAGHTVVLAFSGEDAVNRLAEEEVIDLVVTDYRMGEVDGMAVLAEARKRFALSEVIIMTGHGTIANAVAALKAGAFDYLEKPINLEALIAVVGRAAEKIDLLSQNLQLKQRLDDKFGFEGIVGESPEMRKLFTLLKQVAPTVATILIQGESGTGKELVAKAIHHNSQRKEAPFVALNCAALSETLQESELFGHEKGAFTGATSSRIGRFEYANGGTLFLDDRPLTVKREKLFGTLLTTARPKAGSRSTGHDHNVQHRSLSNGP